MELSPRQVAKATGNDIVYPAKKRPWHLILAVLGLLALAGGPAFAAEEKADDGDQPPPVPIVEDPDC